MSLEVDPGMTESGDSGDSPAILITEDPVEESDVEISE